MKNSSMFYQLVFYLCIRVLIPFEELRCWLSNNGWQIGSPLVPQTSQQCVVRNERNLNLYSPISDDGGKSKETGQELNKHA